MKGRVRLDWLGVVLIAWSALARALVMTEPFPGWDADPTQIAIAIIGLGPTGSLALDVLAWLGAGLVLGSRRHRGFDPLAALALFGGLCMLIRAALFDAGDVDSIRITSAWAAGWASCASLIIAGRSASARSVLGAVFLAAVLLLAAKALVQVFVEHPQMLAQFDLDRAASLTAQGFEPGSPQALIYERRLRQPDPTAWFGLSNVLASFAAMAAVSIGAAAFRVRGQARLGLVLAAGVPGFVLVLIGSKAGFGVLAIGVLAALATRLLKRRWSVAVVLVLMVIPTLAVVARGLTGVPEGERSLLFRWFYAEGAARVTLDAMPTGTGASGFQDAYAIVKTPLATEDVASPHMILWDYASTMGIFGVLSITALVWAAVRLAHTMSYRSSHTASVRRRRILQSMVVAMILPPVLLGVFLESEATTIESAIARLVGVLAWGVVSMLFVSCRLPSRAMLGAAAFVLLAHAQLDMVLSLPGSATLALAIIGLAAASRGTVRHRLPRLAMPVAASIGLALTASAIPGIWRWESLLRRSSDRLAEVVEAREALTQRSPAPADQQALNARFQEAAELAFDDLLEASRDMPRDPRTSTEAGRMGSRLSVYLAESDLLEKAGETIALAEGVLVRSLEVRPRASSSLQLGLIRLQRARIDPDSTDALGLLAIADFERAAELSPRSARVPAFLAQLHQDRGEVERARLWARQAIELDNLTVLDPLSALPEAERRTLEGILRGP